MEQNVTDIKDTTRSFKCPACKLQYDFTQAQIKSHKRVCTHRQAKVFYALPNENERFEISCLIKRSSDNRFHCRRCPKNFMSDNAIQNHTKKCFFQGNLLDDPLSAPIVSTSHSPTTEERHDTVIGLSPQPPVIDLRKVTPRAGSRIISSGPSGGAKLPDVPHTSNPIPPPLSGRSNAFIVIPNQGTPPLAPPPSVGRPLFSSTPLIRLPEQYRVPVVSNSSSLRAAPDKPSTSRDGALGLVPPQPTFQVSPDLYRPRRTPIRRSEKREEVHSPAKSAPPLGKRVAAHMPSARHHPYASGRDYKHRPLSADTAVGFNVSRNLFKPQRTPISRRGKLNGPSPLPFVVPSRVVNHMLQSPFELPTPETRFNPARRLDFTRQRAAKKKVGPNMGSTDDVFGPQTSDSRRAPDNSVATTSTTGALSTVSQPSFYVSPNSHNPPETPISNSPGVRSASLQIPALDRGLQDVLETILTRLQDKCPMCYYQGYNYDHTLYGCPKNAVSKLAGSKDTQWERWKGEVYVAVKGTHCWACFIPLHACVQIPHKRPIKFHKGERGYGRNVPGRGCMWRDTTLPMAYLAWRQGNMVDILKQYAGLSYRPITENLDTFTAWFVSLGHNQIPPSLLFLHAVYSIRGMP